MPSPRKLTSPLGLAVLAALHERSLGPDEESRSMHPYEVATMLRSRGKDQSIKIKWGSLYTVVQTLEKQGYIEATGTTRQGRRPERTSYQITPTGTEALEDSLRESIAFPRREYLALEGALSFLPVLHPDEAIALLEQRLRLLDVQVSAESGVLAHSRQQLPRLVLIEEEYHVAMLRAEADWVRGFLRELKSGAVEGIDEWRRMVETGVLPPEADRFQRGPTDDG